MSLELQDVGAIKVHPEVHALLKATAITERLEMNALIRDVLHKWAKNRVDAMSMATDLVKAKGLREITGGWQ